MIAALTDGKASKLPWHCVPSISSMFVTADRSVFLLVLKSLPDSIHSFFFHSC